MENLLPQAAALVEVIIVDLALSADNAIAVGLAAAALPPVLRRRAVSWGVVIALGLRIIFGLMTVELLKIRGLMLIGGIILLWVAWRTYLDLKQHTEHDEAQCEHRSAPKDVTFSHALFSIVVANIALSLDNVLAVAGVARNSPAIMTFGVLLAVLLMGLAASLIARLIDSHRWIGYLGVTVIVVAGITMAWQDGHTLLPEMPAPPQWLQPA